MGRNSQIRVPESEFVESRHHSAKGNSCPRLWPAENWQDGVRSTPADSGSSERERDPAAQQKGMVGGASPAGLLSSG